MKHFLFIASLLICLSAGAMEYVGTMRLSGGYTLDNVRVTLDEKGNLTLYRVKFARMMPVRVDVLIPSVERKQENNRITISGDSIVPMVHNKPHQNRLITDLQGCSTQQSLVFRCMVGSKLLEYEGRVTQELQYPAEKPIPIMLCVQKYSHFPALTRCVPIM